MFLYSSWMKRLSWLPTEEDIQMSLPVICKFVSWVDGRLQLFKISSNNNFQELPSSEEGLEIHIRRSIYQSGWIWGNSTRQEQVPPVKSYGWTVQEESLSIHWTKLLGQSISEKLTIRPAAASLSVVSIA